MNDAIRLFDNGKHYESGTSAAKADKKSGKFRCGFLYPRRYSDNADWQSGYNDEYDNDFKDSDHALDVIGG